MRDQPPLQLADDARKRAIASLRKYVSTELDQEIGDLKASLVLDYFLIEIGPTVYNTAIADAKAFFDERSSDLAALCTRDEFPFWVTTGKKRR